MKVLDYYGVECAGKRVAVIGRSLVVGRPVAMMLLERNATVTICHRKTRDVAAITREADIIVTAAGAAGSLTHEMVRAGQVVVDVSTNWVENEAGGGRLVGAAESRGGHLVGDAVFDEVAEVVAAITPVPGGVGAVTTSVLMEHVVEVGERMVPTNKIKGTKEDVGVQEVLEIVNNKVQCYNKDTLEEYLND